VISSARGE